VVQHIICFHSTCINVSVSFISVTELLHVCRYTGHVNSEFRIDSTISSSDRHVLSGSEDGCIYVWHLVDVSNILVASVVVVFAF